METSMGDHVQKVLDILEQEDGRTFEEKKAEAIQYLQTQTNTALAEKMLDIAAEDEKGARMKSKFWNQGATIPATDGIILRDVKESDRPFFVKLQHQYSIIKSMLKDDSTLELLWKEHTSCKTLMCTIENNGTYVGYCGIKNLGARGMGNCHRDIGRMDEPWNRLCCRQCDDTGNKKADRRFRIPGAY